VSEEINVNSPDWLDGFHTAEAERCYEIKAERDRLRARVSELEGALQEAVALRDFSLYDTPLGEVVALDERFARWAATLTDTRPPEGEPRVERGV
jgi:hypothetical protein